MLRLGLNMAISAAVCCALAACASDHSPTREEYPRVAPFSGLILPAPSELHGKLQEARRASYVDGDLTKIGANIRLDLPNQHATKNVPDAEFTPDFTQPGASFDGLAYGMYGFANLQGYDRDDVVNSSWITSPDSGTCWIGLANWGADRWDWFLLGPGDKAGITPSVGGPLDNFIDFGGGLLMAVVVTGNQTAVLHTLRLGTKPPQAMLSASPPAGVAPLDVTLDASDSSDPDGSIVKYEWDLDGNGTFEQDTGTTSSVQQNYADAGTFTASVRVTDNYGASSTWSTSVQAFEEWNHTWGKTGDDVFNALVVAGSTIYAAGSVLDGADNDAAIQAYRLDGTVLWRKQWDSGGGESIRGLAVSADGNTIYAAGYTTAAGAGGVDWLVQAWTKQGEVQWTKLWGSPGLDNAGAVVLSGGDLFVCGTSSFGSPANTQAAIVRFSETGQPVWERAWGGSGLDDCQHACLIPVLLGNPSIGMIGETASFGAGMRDLLYLRFNLEGEVTSAMTWGDGGVQVAGDIKSSLLYGTYASCDDITDPPNAVILRVRSGDPGFAYSLDMGSTNYAKALAFDGSDLIFTGMAIQPGSGDDCYLGRFNLDTLALNLQNIAKAGTKNIGWAIARMPDGSLLTGGMLDSASPVTWQGFSATTTDRAAIHWIPVNQPASPVSGVLTSKSILATFGGGTADSGGGEGDCFLGVHKF